MYTICIRVEFVYISSPPSFRFNNKIEFERAVLSTRDVYISVYRVYRRNISKRIVGNNLILHLFVNFYLFRINFWNTPVCGYWKRCNRETRGDCSAPLLFFTRSFFPSFFFFFNFFFPSPSARIRMRVRQRLQITTISAATPIAHRLLSVHSATRSPRDLIGNYWVSEHDRWIL